MKVFVGILFLIAIMYYGYKFIQVLIRMKKIEQNLILPITYEEIAAIRTYQQRTLKSPAFSNQKTGIIMYSILLLLVITTFCIGMFLKEFELTFYPLIFLPLFHSYNFLNLFAVTNDGIICGTRFVAWKKIKSFKFVRIDINHRYYGHSKKVNDKYELRIGASLHVLSCIVTTDEMKEKLDNVLREHAAVVRNNK